MDDGKCLLDVISDPQALKEFFRSTSQISFVEGKVPPLTDETDNKAQTTSNLSKNENVAFSTGNLQTLKNQPLHSASFPSKSTNSHGNFLGNKSSINNSISNNVGGSTKQEMVTSSVQSGSNFVAAQSATIASSQTTISNSPLTFAFSDAGKARNILSTSSVSLPAVNQPVVLSPQQNTKQQAQTPPRLTQSAMIRPQGSPLPTLKPKGIAPRPQTLTTNAGQMSQITIQGNTLTSGVKTTPMKPQLVAIRPKIVISQSSATGSGISSQTSTAARSKQTLQNTFTLGGKAQPQLAKQIISNLSVPQLKQGVSNQVIGKAGLGNLVQLQPKQIAPKPEQVSAAGKGQLNQTQAQLVQSLIAQNQAQFGVMANVGQNDLKATNLSQDSLTQQKIMQQNQLKKMLQQNQLVQQALQVRTQQQNTQVQQQNTQTQQQQQNVALLQMKSPPSSSAAILSGQQTKVQIPSKQISVNTADLASQLREAINNKQLLQFLEKNPLVTQQLLQLNMRQAEVAGRQQGVTMTTSSVTPVKSVTQLQKSSPTTSQLAKGTVNQLQTLAQMQKSPITPNQKPVVTVTQFQKPNIISQQPKPITNIVQLQKSSATSVTQIPKVVASNTTKPSIAVTLPNPKKIVSIPSSGQATQLSIPSVAQSTIAQKSDQKPVTQQKVVIVQNAGSVSTVSAGQPKVLLQTKEGRPILLSQEQFRQIQAQLASKNLSIQGKLVTAAPVSNSTTTTAGVKTQVVVKNEPTTAKVNQKVLSVAAKTPPTKQEVTKSTKRPIKAIETEESKLIKRVKLSIQKDQNDVCTTDIHKPFKSHKDAITRLTPYHVYSEPMPNERMQHKANMLLDKLALQLTHKSDKMINKYRQLLLNDMQRDIPSAELVMVNRIYLADEKAALLQKKQAMLEEAKQVAQAARATLSQNKSNSTETTTANQQPMDTSATESTNTHVDTSDAIEISDDDSSPITSANSFLTDISRTDDTLVNRTLEPG